MSKPQIGKKRRKERKQVNREEKEGKKTRKERKQENREEKKIRKDDSQRCTAHWGKMTIKKPVGSFGGEKKEKEHITRSCSYAMVPGSYKKMVRNDLAQCLLVAQWLCCWFSGCRPLFDSVARPKFFAYFPFNNRGTLKKSNTQYSNRRFRSTTPETLPLRCCGFIETVALYIQIYT